MLVSVVVMVIGVDVCVGVGVCALGAIAILIDFILRKSKAFRW